MTLQQEIRKAIGAHGTWKARLEDAIRNGVSDFSYSVVRTDNQCEFGKWLHGISDTAVKNSADYRTCVDLHRRFHEVAARVLKLATGGKAGDAQAEMAPRGAFAVTSAELSRAMMNWAKNNG